MIRTAVASDIDRIIEIASRSLIDGPYAGIIKDVPIQARKCAELVMASGKIILAANDDGLVIGLIGVLFAYHHFSGQPYATELMWYILPEHRKGNNFAAELRWKAEQEAAAWGAEDMLMTAPNEDVAALYKRAGYEKLEVVCRKKLGYSYVITGDSRDHRGIREETPPKDSTCKIQGKARDEKVGNGIPG